jgi:glycosyltransferase involved in cell wall biosynthesis
MNVLIWHVHGSWMTNFVQGSHTYLVPVEPARGPDGRGRAETWEWPANAVERTADELGDSDIDALIVQNERQLDLATEWLGEQRRRAIPTIWLEHNAPQGAINAMCHPAKNRPDITVVHVTCTNALFWDTGDTEAVVIEHGVIDPGDRWSGSVDRTAVVINEPLRRWRVTGSDLLAEFAPVTGLDLFGLGAGEFAAALDEPCWLTAHGEPQQDRMHDELALRRCYLHPFRWTSLGLSLIEAMMLGMPVVALATTEVAVDVPADAGVVATDLRVLNEGLRTYRDDPDLARAAGAAGRASALARHGVDRFLSDWERLLTEIVEGGPGGGDEDAALARGTGRLQPAG